MPAGRVTPDPTRLARVYARMRRDVAGVRTIAVTGTKGKTSTTEFIGQLLQAAGLRTAISTTESARIGARRLTPCEHLGDFAAFVASTRRARVQCLVVELCSSALTWNVHRGLDLDAAALTNIGTDHISNHGNVRNYVAVKARLFRDLRPRPASSAPVAIVNADDPHARDFRRQIAPGVHLTSYGLGARTGWPVGWRRRPRPRRHLLHGPRPGRAPPALPHAPARRLQRRQRSGSARRRGRPRGRSAPGGRQCRRPGTAPRPLPDRRRRLRPPSGRGGRLRAHAGERRLGPGDGARPLPARPAARGVRLRRRLLQGQAAADGCHRRPCRRCDHRDQRQPSYGGPRAIALAILRGIPTTRRRGVRVDLDRARAIGQAIAEARGGDVVVLLGKGAERTQEVDGRTYPFSDTRVARQALARRPR